MDKPAEVLQQVVKLMESTTLELDRLFARWDADGGDSNFLKRMAMASPEERAQTMLDARNEAVRTGQMLAYEFLRFHVELVSSTYAQMNEWRAYFERLRDLERE